MLPAFELRLASDQHEQEVVVSAGQELALDASGRVLHRVAPGSEVLVGVLEAGGLRRSGRLYERSGLVRPDLPGICFQISCPRRALTGRSRVIALRCGEAAVELVDLSRPAGESLLANATRGRRQEWLLEGEPTGASLLVIKLAAQPAAEQQAGVCGVAFPLLGC